MKKWLIASAICIIPIIFLGIVNPMVVIMMKSPKHNLADVRVDRFLWYVGILSVCISVVLTTTIGMVRYADKIDKLDKKDKELDEEWSRIQSIRRNYEKLIANEKSTVQQGEERTDS